jgi:hypothetical protein
MCLKIRCDGESEKFCKIFWELNSAYVQQAFSILFTLSSTLLAICIAPSLAENSFGEVWCGNAAPCVRVRVRLRSAPDLAIMTA